ncbi:DUF1501 domain-containing protein [Acuticoccus kandeliae]|uniref:DUF1501 domain-containing protein n=1 Tax=Acuticoccus kandeliae TaxID=2073160 RepID=UPI000D3EBFB8|nr:DUF1501 domain-containing protein [Acuticoccus kandeliae]
MLHPTRRGFLAGGAAFTAWASIPKLARAAGTRDPRYITIILRGGMDGLATVAPIGDPAYEAVRDMAAMPTEGPDAGVPLDGFFVLNSRMPRLADLYRNGEALFVHAAHTPYRDRSHFQAQDVLENGTTSDLHHRDGWLGRAIGLLDPDERIARQGGFAAASATPLVMRGAPNVVTWLPPGLPAASDDTRARLLSLYEHTDPVLAQALSEGLRLEMVAGSEREVAASLKAGMEGMDVRGIHRQTVAAATAAGRAMSADDGPRIGFLDMTGFDTHRGQRVVNGSLGLTLSGLDLAIEALRLALGPAWKDTVVTVMTEFGRTVRMNGSQGTDHGTATVAMILGGAVAGGRVISDWPGLSDKALYEGRDLYPTTDLRAVLKGTLRDHLGIDAKALGVDVFPETADLRPVDGLLRG